MRSDNRLLLRLLVPILLPFAGAILLAIYPPVVPDPAAGWQGWLDPAFFVLFGLGVIAGFIIMTTRILNQWDCSRPDTPEQSVREFYRAAAMRKPPARRLGALIAGFEVPGPRVRPVFSWLTAAAAPDVGSPKALAKYWRALLRGNRDVTRSIKLRGAEVEHPFADVAVAHLDLQVTVTRRLQAGLSVLAGLAIFVAPFALGPEFIRGYGLSFWTAVVAAAALGYGVTWLLRVLFKAVVERRDVKLSKVLVRNGYHWALVYGEFESEDEADLSWLKTFKP